MEWVEVAGTVEVECQSTSWTLERLDLVVVVEDMVVIVHSRWEWEECLDLSGLGAMAMGRVLCRTQALAVVDPFQIQQQVLGALELSYSG